MSIGIARAGLNYEYVPFWNKFFLSLGIPFSFSKETDEKILKLALDNGTEMCLPMKLYFGHCLWLKDKVDNIFIPSYIRQGKYLFCPLTIGMNDMVIMMGLNTLTIDVEINEKGFLSFDFNKFAKVFGVDDQKVKLSYDKALDHHLSLKKQMEIGITKEKINKKIAIVGHSYCIKDKYMNFGIFNILKEIGVDTITAEAIPQEILIEQKINESHWVLTKNLMQSIEYFMHDDTVAGLICLLPFNCGPDFLVESLATKTKPFLLLRIDEHSGDAAFVTRIEAFMDLMNQRDSKKMPKEIPKETPKAEFKGELKI